MNKSTRSRSRAEVIEELQRVARALSVTRLAEETFYRHSAFRSAIHGHFDRWSEACRAAGLETNALPPPRRKHTLEACIAEMQRVARLLGTESLSSKTYGKYATIGAKAVRARFGNSWSAALEAAGLKPTCSAVPHLPTPEQCVDEIKRVAASLEQNHLTRAEFRKHSVPRYNRAVRNMGSWHNALAAAGLTPSPAFNPEVSLAELANDFLNASVTLGRVPTLLEVTRRSEHADRTFASKHGGYGAFKRRAIEHLFATGARIPQAVREAFETDLERSSRDHRPTPLEVPRIAMGVLNQHGVLASLRECVRSWRRPSLTSELKYSDALAAYLRAVLPEEAQVEREYRHEGTTCDLRIAYGTHDEVFIEVKWRLQKKAEYDRLVGQVTGLKPSKNSTMVVLIGDTDQRLLGRLRAQFPSCRADQQGGEDRIVIEHLP